MLLTIAQSLSSLVISCSEDCLVL